VLESEKKPVFARRVARTAPKKTVKITPRTVFLLPFFEKLTQTQNPATDGIRDIPDFGHVFAPPPGSMFSTGPHWPRGTSSGGTKKKKKKKKKKQTKKKNNQKLTRSEPRSFGLSSVAIGSGEGLFHAGV